MKDKDDNKYITDWKSILINKINLKQVKQDIVKVRIYEVYGKEYCILEFNGSYFIQSNAGNIQTVLEKIINERH